VGPRGRGVAAAANRAGEAAAGGGRLPCGPPVEASRFTRAPPTTAMPFYLKITPRPQLEQTQNTGSERHNRFGENENRMKARGMRIFCTFDAVYMFLWLGDFGKDIYLNILVASLRCQDLTLEKS
jgi:hypothetical protein